MPTTIYVNGALAITSFDVQVNQGQSGWTRAAILETGKKYRFAIKVLNNSGTFRGFDLGNLKVLDLFNPVNFLLDRQEVAYSKIKVVVCPPAGGLGAYQFYKDSTCAGPFMPAGNVESSDVLARGKSTYLYIYFKWTGGMTPILPFMPGKYLPMVKMKAKELKIHQQAEGPLANLQPNLGSPAPSTQCCCQ